MKKCPYCGKEYSDDATLCANDAQPLVPVTPPLMAASHSTVRGTSRIAKQRIAKFSIHQTSKIIATLYFLIALLAVPFGLIMMITGKVAEGLMLAAMPLLYGIGGYVFCALGCWVYNLIAKWVGGIEFTVEFEEVERF